MSNQVLPLTTTELRVFDTVDEIIIQAITAGDPVPAMNFANELIRSSQVRGVALAKLFYGLSEQWNLFQAAGYDDNFVDFTEVHTGYSAQTITKYTRMWKNIFANPEISENVKKQLMGREIGQLLLLTALAGEGVDEDKMEEIANTSDERALKEAIRSERGERTSSATSVRIYLQLREEGNLPRGCLFVRRGNQTTIVGSLDVDSGEELVEKAINRIVNGAGISEVL